MRHSAVLYLANIETKKEEKKNETSSGFFLANIKMYRRK